MKTITFTPKGGVCAKQMEITVSSHGVIASVHIVGGCAGNSQGVARLVEGMPVSLAITKLQGIDCKGRGTSCPDQLSVALASMAADLI